MKLQFQPGTLTVTTELEPPFEHAILIAITEVDVTYILTELNQKE